MLRSKDCLAIASNLRDDVRFFYRSGVWNLAFTSSCVPIQRLCRLHNSMHKYITQCSVGKSLVVLADHASTGSFDGLRSLNWLDWFLNRREREKRAPSKSALILAKQAQQGNHSSYDHITATSAQTVALRERLKMVIGFPQAQFGPPWLHFKLISPPACRI